jgi:hypothetical protein
MRGDGTLVAATSVTSSRANEATSRLVAVPSCLTHHSPTPHHKHAGVCSMIKAVEVLRIALDDARRVAVPVPVCNHTRGHRRTQSPVLPRSPLAPSTIRSLSHPPHPPTLSHRVHMCTVRGPPSRQPRRHPCKRAWRCSPATWPTNRRATQTTPDYDSHTHTGEQHSHTHSHTHAHTHTHASDHSWASAVFHRATCNQNQPTHPLSRPTTASRDHTALHPHPLTDG